ncbi:MAG: two component transcriptional regulator, AraC family [Clostridia bacterium]|jgi:two-component system response regulator YesN|nr:two component transcriptional regulator, AraC family [Clostridia bacterium]
MLKIMIVDDMDIIRREIKRLKLWGEETGFVIADEAKNGHEALEKLMKNPVDLIITDIRMPKIDGIELLKRITAEKLCACVVLISDHSEFSYARQGLVLGAFDYMVKPVDEEELKKLLLRARDYIVEKKIEQEKIQQLEKSLQEKLEVYFPHSEISQLVELMKVMDARTKEYAEHIVEVVYTTLNYDLIKTESVLNKIIYEIVSNLQKDYKWLDKFIINRELESVGFSRFMDLAFIKVSFISRINGITLLLRKLHYGIAVNEMMEQVCRCVLENVDNGISLSTVSDLIFMNKNYVSEAFKQKAGISFTEYLTIVKMERAKKLIADGRLKTYELAEMLGFKDIEYFSKLFKKHIKCSPTEYKNNIMHKY